MSAREPILLSPYRLPTHSTLYLADEEVAAILNGYLALWHPAALARAGGLPRIASPYDHEDPSPGHLYAVPDNPPLMLSDDWIERARAAGALVFQSTADRATTLANLLEALGSAPAPEGEPPFSTEAVPPDRVPPFLGVGFGLVQVEALFEAMSHESALGAELWEEVQAAARAASAPDGDWLEPLRRAAGRLLAAREVVYGVSVHVVDLTLPDQPDRISASWPAADAAEQPWNLVAPAALIERLAREEPDRLARLREGVAADRVEVVGGPYLEREDPLLPLESQVWNLLRGQEVYREHLGQPVRVLGRRRFGFHPSTPLLAQTAGISRALLVVFDDAVIPTHRATVVSWPSPDGKQVEAFTRTPQPADSPQTYFHLAHHLHETIMQDQAATLALVHRGKPASDFYRDWLELSRLAPVLGRWTTLSNYFNEVTTGDYTSAAAPDEFHGDYLSERTPPLGDDAVGLVVHRPTPHPVSGFAAHLRARRKLDTALTLAAIQRGLRGAVPEFGGEPFDRWLAGVENRFEAGGAGAADEVQSALDHVATALASRLVARGEARPGFLVLNPCSFTRRVPIELPGVTGPIPLEGPVKGCQLDAAAGVAHVVAEVPGLGFAWIPRSAPGGATPASRMRMADDRCVRNEFLEAEIDPQTGGLRAIRDQRTRVGRLGQILVFNPGSVMRCQKVTTTSTGPALGEIVTEGVILDDQQQELASFRQRFRVWIGRPLLDLRIEIQPRRPPEGYPWHSYYAARFAWRDERSYLLRGVNGTGALTSHTRPETPDYLEVRAGRQNAVIFPGGLPFHQRHGGRMADVLLTVPGETATTFDLGIGVDRDNPMQTAWGLASPVAVVPVDRGPPHVGATGWLYHLDAANLLLTGLRPSPDGSDAVLARLLECGGFGGAAELRCPRDPVRALVQDAAGNVQYDANLNGDAVTFDVGAQDLMSLRVEFS